MKKVIIILLPIILFSCSNSLKDTKWANSRNKVEIEKLMDKISKSDSTFKLNYEQFSKLLNRENDVRYTFEWINNNRNATKYYGTYQDFKRKLGIGNMPLVEFLSDKKVSISERNYKDEVTKKYYDYKLEESVIDIFYSNKKNYSIYNGNFSSDSILILYYASGNNKGELFAKLRKITIYEDGEGNYRAIPINRQKDFIKKYPGWKKQ